MSEMVERVAKALSVAATNNPDPRNKGQQLPQAPWEEQPEGWRQRCEREARVVIAAMREPTDAMVDDADYLIDLSWGTGAYPDTKACWRAMIDAALAD